jgi:hypothetical protein
MEKKLSAINTLNVSSTKNRTNLLAFAHQDIKAMEHTAKTNATVIAKTKESARRKMTENPNADASGISQD